MAPSSQRRHTAAVLLLLLSLSLLSVVSHAAREVPAASSRTRTRSHAELHQLDEEATTMTSLPAVDERCGGDNEECQLMRRTLVAHTDYIYTQGGHG